MIQAKILFKDESLYVNTADPPSQSGTIAMQQWLKGTDGAKIIEVSSEAEAIELSKNDTKNLYVWVSS